MMRTFWGFSTIVQVMMQSEANSMFSTTQFNELNNVHFKAFLAFLCPILHVPYAYFKAVKMSCTQRLLSKRLFFYMSNAQQFKVKKSEVPSSSQVNPLMFTMSLFLSKIYLEKSFEFQLLNQHLHRKPLLAAICHFSINVV